MDVKVPKPRELVITADLLRQAAPAPPAPERDPLTKVIHVSPGTIRENYTAIQEGRPHDVKPAVVVKFGSETIHAFRVDILGPSRILQNDTNGLQNGARVWIETEAEIDLHTTRQDAT